MELTLYGVYYMYLRYTLNKAFFVAVIAPKESKLIVVTSRDALAVSCDESSSEATLSDSPLRQVDFDGGVNAPPNLKASRGISAIFPKFEWNNNNVLYQQLPKQPSNSQDSWASYGYVRANTSDLSKSESETNTASTRPSKRPNNANTNHRSDKSSDDSSGTSSGTTSSSSSTSTGTSADTESQTQHTSDTSASSSSSSSVSSDRESSESREESMKSGSMLRRYLKASRQNTAYYCPSTSSLETRLKPMPLTRGCSVQSFMTTDRSSNNSTYSPPYTWHPNQSRSGIALDTPKRKRTNFRNDSWRSTNKLYGRPTANRFQYNNLQASPVLTDVSSSCQSRFESDGEKNVAVIYPTSSTTVQTVKPIYPETMKVAAVDRNHSCALTTDLVATPNWDPIDPEIQGQDQYNISLDPFLDPFQSTDPNCEANFAELFQNLRAKLTKERGKYM